MTQVYTFFNNFDYGTLFLEIFILFFGKIQSGSTDIQSQIVHIIIISHLYWDGFMYLGVKSKCLFGHGPFQQLPYILCHGTKEGKEILLLYDVFYWNMLKPNMINKVSKFINLYKFKL